MPAMILPPVPPPFSPHPHSIFKERKVFNGEATKSHSVESILSPTPLHPG